MKRFTVLVAGGALLVAALAGCSSSSSSSGSTTTTAGGSATTVATPSTLPPQIVLPLSRVQQAFPEVTKVGKSGLDETAIGDTVANYGVIYTDGSGEKKVTISVGQYADTQRADANYAVAVQASKDAPGFQLTEAPDLGQQAFAGTSQVGAEQHFGLGAIDGRLIVAATYAGGIPVTPENSAKLIALTAEELALAKQTLGAGAG